METFKFYWNDLLQLKTALLNSAALLQVAVFFLVWWLVWLPIALPLAVWLRWQPLSPLEVRQKLTFVTSLYLLAPLILWAAAQVEGVPLASYGFTGSITTLVSLLLGLGLGLAGLGLLFGVQLRLGWLAWQPSNLSVWPILLPTLGLALLVGWIEEWVFRGFLLHQLQQDYPMWGAALLTSLIFALLHLVWDGRGALPQLPGLGLMGLVLVVACWVDGGRIALAWGLHAGWVWGIASLDMAQRLQVTNRVSPWLTGLGGQPLAGAIGLLLLLLTGLGLWGWGLGAGL